MSQPQKKQTVEEATRGCQFCAGRIPKEVKWSCGWCGLTITFVLPEQRGLCNHIEGIAEILGVEGEDVLDAILLMLEDDEQQEVIEAVCDVFYSEETSLAIPVKPMPVAERPKLLDVVIHD